MGDFRVWVIRNSAGEYYTGSRQLHGPASFSRFRSDAIEMSTEEMDIEMKQAYMDPNARVEQVNGLR